MSGVLAVEVATLPFATHPDLVRAIGFGCWLSLPSLLLVWSSIRSGRWRYSIAVLLSLFSGLLYARSTGAGLLQAMLPMASAVLVFQTLLITKQLLGNFAWLKHDRGQFLEDLRFNVSHLLIATTFFAVMLPIGKMFWPALADVNPGDLVVYACVIALVAFNTLIFVWALLGKQVILRTCIAVPVGVAALLACAEVCDRGLSIVPWYTFTGLQLILSMLLMVAFRLSGWRFGQGA